MERVEELRPDIKIALILTTNRNRLYYYINKKISLTENLFTINNFFETNCALVLEINLQKVEIALKKTHQTITISQ